MTTNELNIETFEAALTKAKELSKDLDNKSLDELKGIQNFMKESYDELKEAKNKAQFAKLTAIRHRYADELHEDIWDYVAKASGFHDFDVIVRLNEHSLEYKFESNGGSFGGSLTVFMNDTESESDTVIAGYSSNSINFNPYSESNKYLLCKNFGFAYLATQAKHDSYLEMQLSAFLNEMQQAKKSFEQFKTALSTYRLLIDDVDVKIKEVEIQQFLDSLVIGKSYVFKSRNTNRVMELKSYKAGRKTATFQDKYGDHKNIRVIELYQHMDHKAQDFLDNLKVGQSFDGKHGETYTIESIDGNSVIYHAKYKNGSINTYQHNIFNLLNLTHI